jgi:hypothetical protein
MEIEALTTLYSVHGFDLYRLIEIREICEFSMDAEEIRRKLHKR